MGEPVRIADVAARLVARENRPIEIVYTGLGRGEKLHEELLGAGEDDHRPHHPLISHVGVPALDPTHALALDPWAPPEEVLAELAALAGTDAAADEVPAGADVTGRIPIQPTASNRRPHPAR